MKIYPKVFSKSFIELAFLKKLKKKISVVLSSLLTQRHTIMYWLVDENETGGPQEPKSLFPQKQRFSVCGDFLKHNNEH